MFFIYLVLRRGFVVSLVFSEYVVVVSFGGGSFRRFSFFWRGRNEVFVLVFLDFIYDDSLGYLLGEFGDFNF